jgi:hypothetical protein
MTKVMQYVSDQVTQALGRLAQNSIAIKNSMALAKFLKAQNEEHVLAAKTFENYKKQKEEGSETADQEWSDFLQTEIEVKKLPHNILDQVKEISAADLILLEPLIEEKN